MDTVKNKHDERFRQWQARAPEKTRRLSELLATKLSPALEAVGFEKVGCMLQRNDSQIEGRRLQFERTLDGHIDVVYAFFDKYASPRFQIGFSRRAQSNPDQIIRSGHLVKHASEYYHEWGKPRWVPVALWSLAIASKIVDEVVESVNQVLVFLETGERGPNISQPSDVRPIGRGH